MNSLTLNQLITNQLAFEPTHQQATLISMLSEFICKPSEHKAFIINGYAGTGKTSVISGLIQALNRTELKTVLLAPTGRAAKVLSNYSGHSAYSIHKIIYRQKSAGTDEFNINYNKCKNTVFIIDEASMISNTATDNTKFGSGKLLDDLIEYIYTGDNCCMILLGDIAQLPPIFQHNSPALNADIIKHYGLDTETFSLTEVLRQSSESGILYNATMIRNAISNNDISPIHFDVDFKDITKVSGEELIDLINSSYSNVGQENTIILTYSNKRATLYNRGIRNQVLMKESELSNGDFLMITKNNYFWSKPYENLDFIANGDIAEIIRVGHFHEMYGVRFADITMRLIDYDMEVTARIIIDSLYADTASATEELNTKILNGMLEDYEVPVSKQQFWKDAQQNEYYNALQVKFAYAITGHKAQGGAWQHVFIDQGYLTREMITKEYYQWLYTAVTRATEKLYLVNFSNFFFNE